MALEFRILGPLEVLDGDRELSIRGRKLQALLAILLLHAGEVVAREQLIDELWGEEPPATAAKTLQVHVSRLRRELGGVVETHGSGYRIRVEPERLDLTRFELLVAEGRSALAGGESERAAERLRAALSLWRGTPLPELAGEPLAHARIGRLEDDRLAATEDLLEAELKLGRHSEAIHELEPLVDSHPYRERLRELLILALYRAGRQADALTAYQDARNVLVEQLGLEPGPRLRELHAAILAQDPALEPAARPAEGAEPAAPPARRRWPLAAGLAAVALAAPAVVLLSTGGGEPEARPLSDDSHAVAVIDPAANRVTTAVPVGANPGPLAFEPESRSLWVGNLDDESVTRIDPRTARTRRTIPVDAEPVGLAAGAGMVWVTGPDRTKPYVTARRIDVRFDSARDPVRVETLPGEDSAAVALGGGSLWVAPSLGRLTGLSPASGRPQRQPIDAGPSPSAVTADGESVWVAGGAGNVVSKVDPATGLVDAIPIAGAPADVALGAGAAWVTLSLDDALARVDPETGSVRSTIPVGRRPAGVAVGLGSVWVANSGDGTVSRVDPASGRVTDTIPVGASPQDVVVAAGRVWVSVRPRFEADDEPGGTVRMEIAEGVDSLDPALAYTFVSFQLLGPTCARLMTYPAEAGAAGTRLVPELAEAPPRRSDGGLTYTFTIRAGYRFSPPSGEPVTAQSMKATIERVLHPRMRSGARGLVSDVVAVTASGRELTVRIRAPSSTFTERISLLFFCAVPSGTPIDPDGLRQVPSAGPYYVARYTPGAQIILRRNPGYGGSRPRRPDEIQITLDTGQAGTIRRIQAGEADYTSLTSPSSDVDRLRARYGPGSPAADAGGQRYFVATQLQLDQLIFNTSRPTFASARLRRAVNYALDRRLLAREDLYTGFPAEPTDQYVPPTMPGFRDAQIYPLRPDLAKARRLAGPGRRRVVLYTQGGATHLRYAKIVQANLREIGMEVEIRDVGVSMYPRIARRGEPFDMALNGWVADYPDPLDFLRQLDGRTIQADDNVNSAYFDDPAFNRRLDAAERLPSPAREIALGRLGVEVARTEAPWAALANDRLHEFFSARIGCQVYNPVYGLDFGSLCIRDEE